MFYQRKIIHSCSIAGDWQMNWKQLVVRLAPCVAQCFENSNEIWKLFLKSYEESKSKTSQWTSVSARFQTSWWPTIEYLNVYWTFYRIINKKKQRRRKKRFIHLRGNNNSLNSKTIKHLYRRQVEPMNRLWSLICYSLHLSLSHTHSISTGISSLTEDDSHAKHSSLFVVRSCTENVKQQIFGFYFEHYVPIEFQFQVNVFFFSLSIRELASENSSPCAPTI